MLYMNQTEIEFARQRYANHAVLDKATRFLEQFADQVNMVSDGWAYWRPPVQSAAKLMALIQSGDATETELRRAIVPIKSFYTRKGYSAGMFYPQI